jgi:hypothetical protein
MLGYVTGSRIQGLNSTSSSLRTDVDAWLTEQDGKGYLVNRGAGTGTINPIVVGFNIAAGVWTIAAAAGHQLTDPAEAAGAALHRVPAATATTMAGTSAVNGSLASILRDKFPSIANGSVIFVLADGGIVGTAYSQAGTAVAGGGLNFGGVPALDGNVNNALSWNVEGRRWRTGAPRRDGQTENRTMFGSFPIHDAAWTPAAP